MFGVPVEKRKPMRSVVQFERLLAIVLAGMGYGEEENGGQEDRESG
jgi:restriction endonuclease Mrr